MEDAKREFKDSTPVWLYLFHDYKERGLFFSSKVYSFKIIIEEVMVMGCTSKSQLIYAMDSRLTPKVLYFNKMHVECNKLMIIILI